MKYAVITGTSKGLGASIAKLLMNESYHVIGIARNENKELASSISQYTHYKADLSNLEETETFISEIISSLKQKEVDSLLLIQNAAIVTPIEQVGKQSIDALVDHVHVNLLAPMVITNLWLDNWRGFKIPSVIVHVTSGAAKRSVYGWSAYGSTKAGLDRYTDTVAIEQDTLQTGNKIFLFDPSIMDTDMQGEIRSSDPSQFREVNHFKSYKTNNDLRDTEVVAKVLVDRLLQPEKIVNGDYYSVKDFFG